MSSRYIVVFKSTATEEQVEYYAGEVTKYGGEVTHRYDIFKGFAAVIPEQFLSFLQANDAVDYIEPDSIVTIQQ